MLLRRYILASAVLASVGCTVQVNQPGASTHTATTQVRPTSGIWELNSTSRGYLGKLALTFTPAGELLLADERQATGGTGKKVGTWHAGVVEWTEKGFVATKNSLTERSAERLEGSSQSGSDVAGQKGASENLVATLVQPLATPFKPTSGDWRFTLTDASGPTTLRLHLDFADDGTVKVTGGQPASWGGHTLQLGLRACDGEACTSVTSQDTFYLNFSGPDAVDGQLPKKVKDLDFNNLMFHDDVTVTGARETTASPSPSAAP